MVLTTTQGTPAQSFGHWGCGSAVTTQTQPSRSKTEWCNSRQQALTLLLAGLSSSWEKRAVLLTS